MSDLAARTYVALLHHPVYDKHRKVVATAITNLDIHDIARSTRTYGMAGYYIVTPIAAQRELIERIVGHWHTPEGRGWNDKRTDALSGVRVAGDLCEVTRRVAAEHGADPVLVATGARPRAGTVSVAAFRGSPEARSNRPIILIFGTGWGLADEVFEKVHATLDPIRAKSDYNHLSVRSAVAIFCDRFFGVRES